jgi:hypothetical protein
MVTIERIEEEAGVDDGESTCTQIGEAEVLAQFPTLVEAQQLVERMHHQHGTPNS